jgi:hypothetical protein
MAKPFLTVKSISIKYRHFGAFDKLGNKKIRQNLPYGNSQWQPPMATPKPLPLSIALFEAVAE